MAKICLFWPKFAPGVGGNGSSTLFHPQSARPEVGGPKLDQNGPNICQTCGHLWVFDPPLKVDHHQPLKVDHHGGPCRIRSTFKGGCVEHSWQPVICSCSSEYSRGRTVKPPRKTKLIFFTDLGALAFSRALVGLVARALENECHRFDFHPEW